MTVPSISAGTPQEGYQGAPAERLPAAVLASLGLVPAGVSPLASTPIAQSVATGRFRRFNRLLERQLTQSVGGAGTDWEQLLRLVSAHYDQTDEERRGVVRSMQLMAAETEALSVELREQTDSQLQAVLDHVQDVILTVDEAGQVDLFNPTAESIFGYTAAEVQGKPLSLLLPHLALAGVGLETTLEGLATRAEDTRTDLAAHATRALRKDGREFDAEFGVSEARLERQRVFIVCLRDITRRTAEAELAAAERILLEHLAADSPLERSLEAMLVAAGASVGGCRFAVQYFNSATGRLQHGVAPQLAREFLAAMDGVPMGEPGYGSCASALAHRDVVWVKDVASDERWEHRAEAARLAGIVSAWSVPLVSLDGELLGTLAAYGSVARLPGRHEQETLARLGRLAAQAIERHRHAEALRASEQRFRRLFENVVEGVYQCRLDGGLLVGNPALVRLLGAADFAMLEGRRFGEFAVEPLARDELHQRLLLEGEVLDHEFELRTLDGRRLTVAENARLMRDGDGRVCGFEGTLHDITSRRLAELAVLDEKDRAQVTLQSIGDAVISTDALGQIDYLNPTAEQLTGWASVDAIGMALVQVFPLVHETSGEALPTPLRLPLEEGAAWTAHDHVALRRRDGQALGVQCSASPIRGRHGEVAGAVVVFRDVSRERRLRRALSYQASHDMLTGLINRREFEAKLHFLLEGTRATPIRQHALVYVDLDQFKVVNDTCGHPAGDRLLKQVTLLLQTRVRTRDVLARLGGDEFGLLLEDCALDQAMRIAEAVRQSIREFRFVSGPHSLNIGASIGVVEINSRSESAASVMSAVDVACYTAKEGGRDRIHVYQAGEIPLRHREMQWVSRVQRAADEGRFELYFQRILAISKAAVAQDGGHYELMLRMRDEEGKLVAPGEFIPAAERYNLMPGIDRWVVREALAKLAARKGSGQRHSISLNLSGTTLNDERFLEFLLLELSQVELEPGALCFEITETAAITHMANVVYFMRQLKARGVRFALDDFGSGLSSFSYLKTLPVDILKIDGQFVENVVRDPVDRSMVSAICQVARTMGLVTCAERVETQEALEVLAELGVDYAQGYLIGHPKSVRELVPGQ
jgi:diguanylate cyclase (GGDEF)-like protein/PAS domain S-box-containing protein